MLSKKSINSLLLLTGLLSAQNDFGYVSSDNLPEKRCGLPDASPAEVLQSMEDIDYWRASRNFRNTETHVLVAFHVIYNSNGTGNISTSSIQAAVDKLNLRYSPANIYFTLDTINRVQNDYWFTITDELEGEIEGDMRQSTAIDPVHYYNVWSCNMSQTDAAGWNYLPNWSSEDSHWQGTTIDYRYVNGTYETIAHEAGHYFNLYHTFQGGCSAPGDGVDDTPYQDDNDYYPCVESTDSCPDQNGNDPIHNIMNYSSHSCRNEFSPGQIERMHSTIAQYHPGLLENNFYYPNLTINNLFFLADTDGDGNFNPGETVRAKVSVANTWGGDATNVVAILSCDDPRITILDNTIEFTNDIIAGGSAFTLFDYFIVLADEDAEPGSVSANVSITAGSGDFVYSIEEEIILELTLSQKGFPFTSGEIKSSPLVLDADNDGLKEIYFGSIDNKFYGISANGQSLNGYPFIAGNDIQSSPASGDLDMDGDIEIVFGSKDQKLYILNSDGSLQINYSQDGYILSTPVLSDLDGDQDLEIIFGTQEGISGGKLFAIHHDGSDVDGFPVNINERILAGAAVHDIDGNGIKDIVVLTWGKNIWVFDAMGAVREGFPIQTQKRFNASPSIVDIDNDQVFEIVAADDNGDLYVINHDGSISKQFSTGDDIRSEVTVADLNQDGSVELIFVSYDDFLHVWNPVTNSELAGWPVDLGSNPVTAPVLADLNDDGLLNIVTATRSGNVFVFHNNGTSMKNFPIYTGLTIESSPSINDIDSDGDFEILLGTSQGLEVFDIKSPAGDLISWKMFRGNERRTGVFTLEQLMNVNKYNKPYPSHYSVTKNFPNPFNPVTNLILELPTSNYTKAVVIDMNGRLVYTIADRVMSSGRHLLEWNGKSNQGDLVPTGVYVLLIESGAFRSVQKMALIK